MKEDGRTQLSGQESHDETEDTVPLHVLALISKLEYHLKILVVAGALTYLVGLLTMVESSTFMLWMMGYGVMGSILAPTLSTGFQLYKEFEPVRQLSRALVPSRMWIILLVSDCVSFWKGVVLEDLLKVLMDDCVYAECTSADSTEEEILLGESSEEEEEAPIYIQVV